MKSSFPFKIEYCGIRFDEEFRADIFIEGKGYVPRLSCLLCWHRQGTQIGKSGEQCLKKQLLTYLRLTGLKLGCLLNFGEVLMTCLSVRPSADYAWAGAGTGRGGV
jgi:hypothetical protein